MKKEIDVWVNDFTGDMDFDGYGIYKSKESAKMQNGDRLDYLKAKLIIEIPEPRIEVTPSMIREAIKKGLEEPHIVTKIMLRELFGEGWDK